MVTEWISRQESQLPYTVDWGLIQIEKPSVSQMFHRKLEKLLLDVIFYT